MIYEMLIGKNPFNLADEDLSPNEFLEMIQETEITFPHTDVDVRYSDEVKSFIMQLLDKDPSKRISLDNIENHPWFEDMPWNSVIRQTIDPFLKPEIKIDLKNQTCLEIE